MTKNYEDLTEEDQANIRYVVGMGVKCITERYEKWLGENEELPDGIKESAREIAENSLAMGQKGVKALEKIGFKGE